MNARFAQWLDEREHVECRRWHCRLSVRARKDMRRYRPEPCEGCQPHIIKPTEKGKNMAGEKAGTCSGCGREMIIYDRKRNLCGRCRQYVKKGEPIPPLGEEPWRQVPTDGRPGQRVDVAPKPAKDPEPNDYLVSVSFEGYGDLLEKLKARADAEMRPIGLQALWEIRKGLRVEKT